MHATPTPTPPWDCAFLINWTVFVGVSGVKSARAGGSTSPFPDPRPLVERLGREFFRGLPESPGVDLMRDAADAVLYVGKAKNLRKRLGSYRVANPDRMPRRHLRMLRAVVRIKLQICPDESAALARESELLQTLRPKFNRAGTWRPPPRYFAWRNFEQELRLTITESPHPDWRLHGPIGSRAAALRA